ncbi:MAG: hypothetical protein P8P74_05345 [Crocinitomicaceae bacterium]|nr:hypothetical protein [Crocinitomicaceae bacterium]
MKILFDRYGQQVQTQLDTDDRLNGLFETLTNAGFDYDISWGELTTEMLDDYDVLVLTNRMNDPFLQSELAAITQYVSGGGGLWCMANHAAFGDDNLNNNHVRYTGSVCSTYWSAYEAAAYSKSSSAENSAVTLSDSNLSDHPTITGESNWPITEGFRSQLVESIVTRSFCAVYPNSFSETVASLRGLGNVENIQNGEPVTDGVVWNIALSEVAPVGRGRVVIGGDAGWLGDTTSTVPGPGEFQNGGNPQYALNSLSWLGQL